MLTAPPTPTSKLNLGCLYVYSRAVVLLPCVKMSVTQSCSTLCNPMDCSPPGSSVHGILQTRILRVRLPCPSLGDLPDPGIEPVSPAWQADSLPPSHLGSPSSWSLPLLNNCINASVQTHHLFPVHEPQAGPVSLFNTV